MCMRYVNAALGLYAKVRFDTRGNTESLLGMFDTLEVDVDKAGLPVLPDFRIVTRVCVLGSQQNPDNILRRRGKLSFILRLTKCDPEPEKQLGKDLDTFLVDLNDPELRNAIATACFEYLNYSKVTDVAALRLEPGPGKYVLKLLIAEKKDGQELTEADYTVQSMYSLTVGIKT